VQTGGGGLRITAQDLTLDTEPDTEDYGRMSARQIIAEGITGKIRCQTPFRESSSFAAFLSFGDDGRPFIYDVGTGITHWLNDFEAEEFRRLKASGVHACSAHKHEDGDCGAPITAESNQPIAKNDTTTTSAPTTQPPDDEVIATLAAMTPLEYERVRVETANQLGCRPAILDNLVKAACKQDGSSGSLPFPEVDPWPDSVEPEFLLNELSATIHRFVVMERRPTPDLSSTRI